MGTGSDFKMMKFSLVQIEEDQRDTMGMSAARKCLFLSDLAIDLTKEGATGESEPDKLVNLFKKAKSTLNTWNIDTMRRFLGVGRKLMTDPKTRRLLQLWDYLDARNTLIDSITVLRAVCGAAATEDELYHILFLLWRPYLDRNEHDM